jgi:hypothetical protein
MPIHANHLKGSRRSGYRIEGHHGAHGILKAAIGELYPDMIAYFGDTAFGDGPIAELIHRRGGLVFCVADESPTGLLEYMKRRFPGSKRVIFIRDFVGVFPIIQDLRYHFQVPEQMAS